GDSARCPPLPAGRRRYGDRAAAPRHRHRRGTVVRHRTRLARRRLLKPNAEDSMYPVGKPVDGQTSILVDFVRSGHDESYVGATSEPYLIDADRKSIEQVCYAAEAAHDWRMSAIDRREPLEAPHAYLFYLLNNTRTYRVYEQSVIAELPGGR